MPLVLSPNPDMQPMTAVTDVQAVAVPQILAVPPLERQPDPITTTLWSLVGDFTAPSIVFFMAGA